MNKLLLLIALIFTLSACKKENTTTASPSVIGTWELVAEYGGFAGTSNHFPPGNGHTLKLGADSTFQYAERSTIVNQGTFSIVKQGIIIGTQKFDALYYNHNQVGEVIQLARDTLGIGLDYDDGIASVYVRKRSGYPFY